jgi:DNA-binding MarR family transcriptional regulator
MAPPDLLHRFDYLVNDIARATGVRFDREAREQLGLSRAQCRLLWALDLHQDDGGMTQNALADYLETTPMAVGALCARMESAGWISRHDSPTDRRAKLVRLEPAAREPMAAAVRLADRLLDQHLADLSPGERRQLTALLARVHATVQHARDR